MVPIIMAVILKKEKRHSLKNTTPLYLWLSRDRKKAEARLDREYDLTEVQVLKWNPVHNRVAEKDSPVNDHLDELSARLSDPNHSMQEIISKILSKKEKKGGPTLISYVDDYYKEEMEYSKFRVRGTEINYQKAIKHLKSFLHFQNLSEIEIVKFNTSIAEKFKNTFSLIIRK